MASINQNGISTTTLSEYKTQIETIFTNVFGSSFSVDPETAQGQLIGLLALAFEQSDNSIIDMFNGTDIYSATGIQIDYIASNLGIFRKAAVNSEVICEVTGVSGVVLPVGALAEDISGNKYKLKEQVTIPPTNSTTGVFVCQTEGAVSIPANTVTKITEVIQGWETINNSTAGIVGRSEESDSELKKRYISSVSNNSVSQLASIKSCLSSIEDVKQVEVVQNDEDIPVIVKGLSLPAHSITPVVLGGSDQDIITCIGQKKPVGIKTNGDISGQYLDPSYYTSLTVKFYRALLTDIEIQMSIETDLTFPSNGLDQIKDNLVAYIENAKIGKNVIYSRLLTPINQVLGFEVTSLLVGKLGDTLAQQDITINLNEVAILNKDNINITVV
jgi:uncharacterized phage protein gp47/JayE